MRKKRYDAGSCRETAGTEKSGCVRDHTVLFRSQRPEGGGSDRRAVPPGMDVPYLSEGKTDTEDGRTDPGGWPSAAVRAVNCGFPAGGEGGAAVWCRSPVLFENLLEQGTVPVLESRGPSSGAAAFRYRGEGVVRGRVPNMEAGRSSLRNVSRTALHPGSGSRRTAVWEGLRICEP